MEEFAATCKTAHTNYLLFMGNWTKKALFSTAAPAIRNDYFIMPPEGPTRWRAFIAETRWNDRLKREVFVGWWTVSQLPPAKAKGEQEKFFRAYQQERDIGQGFIRRHQIPGRFRNNRWNGWLHRRRILLEGAEEAVENEIAISKDAKAQLDIDQIYFLCDNHHETQKKDRKPVRLFTREERKEANRTRPRKGEVTDRHLHPQAQDAGTPFLRFDTPCWKVTHKPVSGHIAYTTTIELLLAVNASAPDVVALYANISRNNPYEEGKVRSDAVRQCLNSLLTLPIPLGLKNAALDFKWYFGFASLFLTQTAYIAIGTVRVDGRTPQKMLRVPNGSFGPTQVKTALQDIAAFLITCATDPRESLSHIAIWNAFILTFQDLLLGPLAQTHLSAMDLPSKCPALRHTLSRERIEAAKSNIEERRQHALALFSPSTASMVSMGIRALYPNLTLFLAETNPFLDDFQGGEECIDTVLDTICLAAVVQSCISLALIIGDHTVIPRETIHESAQQTLFPTITTIGTDAAKVHEFLESSHGAPRDVILKVSAEIFGHEQTARVTKHHKFDDTMLEVQRREWARLLPAARQEIVTIRAIGQFPILMHAQSVIRVCQRDGLARGFLGRNTGLSLSSPDETLDQVLRPPTGLPPVKCQFMPSDRIGEHNTFFYFLDRT
jgi:hypothetical protein